MNNNPKNPNNTDAVKFLTEGLPPSESLLVNHAVYVLASGDPDSAPVATAIVFTACTRKLHPIPEQVWNAAKKLEKTLVEAQEWEQQHSERIEQSHQHVIAEFKTETSRTSENLRETAKFTESTRTKILQMADRVEPILDRSDEIVDNLNTILKQLRLHEESVRKVADATERIQKIQQESGELVKNLLDYASTNWFTIGFLLGTIVVGTAAMFSPWAAAILFGLGIGFLQWLARITWKLIEKQIEKMEYR